METVKRRRESNPVTQGRDRLLRSAREAEAEVRRAVGLARQVKRYATDGVDSFTPDEWRARGAAARLSAELRDATRGAMVALGDLRRLAERVGDYPGLTRSSKVALRRAHALEHLGSKTAFLGQADLAAAKLTRLNEVDGERRAYRPNQGAVIEMLDDLHRSRHELAGLIDALERR